MWQRNEFNEPSFIRTEPQVLYGLLHRFFSCQILLPFSPHLNSET